MGAVYGPNFLEISFQSITDKFYRIPIKRKLDIYTKLFNLCSEKDPIRVFIDNVLYQWTYLKEAKSYTYCEYEGPLKQEIIDYNKSIEGNGAPYSLFDGLEGWNIMLPGKNILINSIDLKKDLNLDIDYDGRLECGVSSITDFIIFVQRMNGELEMDREAFSDDEDFDRILDFQKCLIMESKKCRDYQMIFVLP